MNVNWKRLDRIGLIWYALEETDTNQNVMRRTQRDEQILAAALFAEREYFDSCAAAVALAREATDKFSPLLVSVVDHAASVIWRCIEKDPGGLSDYADFLESLAEMFYSNGNNLQYPTVLIALAQVWTVIGEADGAKWLLDLLLELDKEKMSSSRPCSSNVALAHCAYAELCRIEGESGYSIVHLRQAWHAAQDCTEPYRHYVIGRYRIGLEKSAYPADVVHAAAQIELHLASSVANECSPWILRWTDMKTLPEEALA